MSAIAEPFASKVRPVDAGELQIDGDPTSVLDALQRDLDCRVRLCSGWPSQAEDLDCQPFVTEVTAGAERFGYLEAIRSRPFEDSEAERLRFASGVIAVELVKQRTAHEIAERFEHDLLSDLIDGGYPIDDRISARAEKLGIDLHGVWTVAAMRACDGPIPKPLVAAARRRTSISEQSLTAVHEGTLVVAVRGGDGKHLEAKLSHLTRLARGMGLGLVVGVGSAAPDLGKGRRQAEAALRLASQSGTALTVHHEQLGMLRFLLDAPDATEMVNLVTCQLGALAENDRRRHGQLLETLRVFLEEGGNKPRTAPRCHIHISTLKYRLGQIAELTRRDLRASQVRFEFMLAFEVLDLLRAIGADPFESRIDALASV